METKSGFLLIPKKEGLSSSKLLGKVKWELELGKKTPLGHAGTLDPLASGLIFAAYGYSKTETYQNSNHMCDIKF